MKALTGIVSITLLTLASIGGARAAGTLPPASQDAAPEPEARRAVLVTGASSGIGRKTAEFLAANGFFVYAGARKEKDLRELDAIENVQSIRLDVTIPEQIEAAVETVRAGGRGLYGLVNNAGSDIIQSTLCDWRRRGSFRSP